MQQIANILKIFMCARRTIFAALFTYITNPVSTGARAMSPIRRQSGHMT
jgi:multisubunit Na+/H+ antiporter MnhG subunit